MSQHEHSLSDWTMINPMVAGRLLCVQNSQRRTASQKSIAPRVITKLAATAILCTLEISSTAYSDAPTALSTETKPTTTQPLPFFIGFFC